jgi:hypothetical protein
MLKFREENLQKNEEFDLIEEQRRKFQLKSKTLTSNICLQKKQMNLALLKVMEEIFTMKSGCSTQKISNSKRITHKLK